MRMNRTNIRRATLISISLVAVFLPVFIFLSLDEIVTGTSTRKKVEATASRLSDSQTDDSSWFSSIRLTNSCEEEEQISLFLLDEDTNTYAAFVPGGMETKTVISFSGFEELDLNTII